jgi:hypothetical protein
VERTSDQYRQGAGNLKEYLAAYHQLDRSLALHAVATSSCGWMAFVPRLDSNGDGSVEVIVALFVVTKSRGYWVLQHTAHVPPTDARIRWTQVATESAWHGTV